MLKQIFIATAEAVKQTSIFVAKKIKRMTPEKLKALLSQREGTQIEFKLSKEIFSRMFKYTPLYANGKVPVIEEHDVFRIVIPYNPIQSESETESSQKTTEKTENHTENHGGLSRIQREILKKLKENSAYSRRELATIIEKASLGGVISALSRL